MEAVAQKLTEAIYVEYESLTRTSRKFGKAEAWADAFHQRVQGMLNAAIYLDVSKPDRDALYNLYNRLDAQFMMDASYGD